MPIKYNLTKYDILADKFHELVLKNGSPLTKDEEVLKAEATLIASFASAHSWQTYKAMIEGDLAAFNSLDIKNEHVIAKNEKWKRVKNIDIQEVASTNIRDGAFYTWLSLNSEKTYRETYRKAWEMLKRHVNEECDGISMQKQQR